MGNSNDETNFPHNLLLTDIQVSSIRKAFANGLSANIIFPKTKFSKMIQLGGHFFSSPREFIVNAIEEKIIKKVTE